MFPRKSCLLSSITCKQQSEDADSTAFAGTSISQLLLRLTTRLTNFGIILTKIVNLKTIVLLPWSLAGHRMLLAGAVEARLADPASQGATNEYTFVVTS
jgi:hypothetical protein